jgi:hypothetical protein
VKDYMKKTIKVELIALRHNADDALARGMSLRLVSQKAANERFDSEGLCVTRTVDRPWIVEALCYSARLQIAGVPWSSLVRGR